MAAPFNIEAYSDALVVLGTAGIVVPVVRRLGISPVLGYLAAGAVLGPLGLGSLISTFPFLYWLTVVDAKNVAGIAELGVVFLLFLIGMELSFERLKAMRRLVFGLGSMQIVLSTAVIGTIAYQFGNSPAVATILGACLALSSTAIVIEVLSNQGRMSTTTGRTSFSVLIAQDLAVIPLLVFISLLGASNGSSLITSLLLALMNAAIAVIGIFVVGRVMLRPLFRMVASTGSTELFVAATLFVIIGTGVAAAMAGMSMALGAFIAGLVLAETEFRKAIETTIAPFKGLLLGVFFFTVGMNIDVREIARDPIWLFASVAGLIAIKATLLIGTARLFRLPWPAAIETGILLGPGGEFAFVAIGMAAALGLIQAPVAAFILAVTSITMALIPVLSLVARRIAPKFKAVEIPDPELAVAPEATTEHAIVIGYGRVGQVVCSLLDENGIRYLAIDNDARAVPEQRRSGREVYYGDASKPEFLQSCGVMSAKAVIVTISSTAATDEIVRQVRALRSDVVIVSRARDANHARHLYAIGVTDAVPETIEASLQLSEAALFGLGRPSGLVIASIHEKRDEFRRELQQAAGRVQAENTHAVRRKTRPPKDRNAKSPRNSCAHDNCLLRFPRKRSPVRRIALMCLIQRRRPMGQSIPFKPIALVVEDDEMQRELVTLLLEECDMGVIQCESGETAMEVLGKLGTSLSMIYTDVNLSGDMTGVDLAHAAANDYPNIHVVVTSGRELPQELPEQALFMQKPWLTLDLLREAERAQDH